MRSSPPAGSSVDLEDLAVLRVLDELLEDRLLAELRDLLRGDRRAVQLVERVLELLLLHVAAREPDVRAFGLRTRVDRGELEGLRVVADRELDLPDLVQHVRARLEGLRPL